MKTAKRALSLLLSLMLVLGTVSVGGVSVSALDPDAYLIIGDDTAIDRGDVMALSGTGWSISVNGDAVTLNLDGLDLTYVNDCISARHLDLTITGSAKLTTTSEYGSPIYFNKGNLTLNGNFILRAQSATEKTLVTCNGNLTVEDGSLDVINTANDAISVDGTMTVNGGLVYAKTESDSDTAITTRGILLNNDEFFALGDEAA